MPTYKYKPGDVVIVKRELLTPDGELNDGSFEVDIVEEMVKYCEERNYIITISAIATENWCSEYRCYHVKGIDAVYSEDMFEGYAVYPNRDEAIKILCNICKEKKGCEYKKRKETCAKLHILLEQAKNIEEVTKKPKTIKLRGKT